MTSRCDRTADSHNFLNIMFLEQLELYNILCKIVNVAVRILI